jgi:hypothetical protein
LIELGSHSRFSITGIRTKSKFVSMTFHYECACGQKPLFRSPDKRLALETWNQNNNAITQ